MKVKMISMAFTPYGVLEAGMILTDSKYPAAFLDHLVKDCNAAEYMEYETKVDEDYEAKKKPLSTQSSPPVKVLPEQTPRKPAKRHRRS